MRNLTLLTDMYELTMVGGYLANGKENQRANFDYFFRRIPDEGGYCLAAGLEQLIDYIRNISFTPEDLAYLEGLGIFPEKVLRYLEKFRFSGDLFAVPEGTVIFPYEPIIRVTAPLPEAQFIESALLNIMNFQTLIATKAARVCTAADGDPVIEFGLRRAHGPDAAIGAARAAFIGGAQGTSNMLAGKLFDIPVRGTVAHSWVESFSSEIDAFRAYCRVYPNDCLLLVDTYDTLKSGIPNAIKIGKELSVLGKGELKGIRLDSGDLAYLSKEARKMLDAEGFEGVKIFASSDLDEWIIESIKQQGGRTDSWGVGTKLVTAYSNPALGGVYKLTAIEENGRMQPKIKRSDNPEKVTNPGLKKVVRFFDDSGLMGGDVMFLEEENLESKPVRVYHPTIPHVSKVYPPQFSRQELLIPIFREGRLVYSNPSLKKIQENSQGNLEQLGLEFKRFKNPHIYHVSLSRQLMKTKRDLLRKAF
ncbi:MAG: nicotinate phosphoribosyltransferase [Deltaproteobacteria bacterium RBG_13_43_22]|nr:MAG: nicotinate phosphoribosyltransferase [Deltaproteobacteria bacterium RBG_13_43_22]